MSESRLILGDCFVELAGLPDASIDSLVTDPPYGINFMGKAWDGAAIQQQAEEKRRETRQHLRLTGSPDSTSRKLIERSGSAFQNRAGEAGAYDFSVTGNRAFQAWVEQWARECLRVLKPGGFALVFGGTRTAHRLACGLEDAGFEIRDEILAWMFGSGFPKSHDISKAIDKSLGAERERVAGSASGGMAALNAGNREHGYRDDAYYENGNSPLSNDAVTDEAKAWSGFGTALKPAHEPIIVARKPLAGTVAKNVLAHGTGGLNIDGCRIGADAGWSYPNGPGGSEPHHMERGEPKGDGSEAQQASGGRWPANVVLVHHEDCVEVGTTVLLGDQRETGNGTWPGGFADVGSELGDSEPNAPVYGDEQVPVWECVEGCPVRMLDEQSGRLTSGKEPRGGFVPHEPAAREGIYGGGKGLWKDEQAAGSLFGDSGGASRFFYCAKVSRAERNAGLEGFDELPSLKMDPTSAMARDGNRGSFVARNHHPTVKPIALMRWLVRLVTPPNGTVLDPFLGSGTTGVASALEGFNFVGIEREADYMKIAEARIRFWKEHGADGLRICAERDAAAAIRKAVEDAGQMSLLG